MLVLLVRADPDGGGADEVGRPAVRRRPARVQLGRRRTAEVRRRGSRPSSGCDQTRGSVDIESRHPAVARRVRSTRGKAITPLPSRTATALADMQRRRRTRRWNLLPRCSRRVEQGRSLLLRCLPGPHQMRSILAAMALEPKCQPSTCTHGYLHCTQCCIPEVLSLVHISSFVGATTPENRTAEPGSFRESLLDSFAC